jgi:hypothetical protein
MGMTLGPVSRAVLHHAAGPVGVVRSPEAGKGRKSGRRCPSALPVMRPAMFPLRRETRRNQISHEHSP